MKYAANHKNYAAVCEIIDSIKTPNGFYGAMTELKKYDQDLVRVVREDKECHNAAQYATEPENTEPTKAENCTIFFISDSIGFGLSTAYAKTATLEPCAYSMTQTGYRLEFLPPRAKYARETRFWRRPRILAANGKVKLPDTVLYNVETKGDMTIKRGKFRAHDDTQFEAIENYLQSNNIEYFYM